MTFAKGLWAAALVHALALVACDAFVGPTTDPIPCPKRCATGGCCGFDEECRSDGCAFVGDRFGAPRDAAAVR